MGMDRGLELRRLRIAVSEARWQVGEEAIEHEQRFGHEHKKLGVWCLRGIHVTDIRYLAHPVNITGHGAFLVHYV